MPLRNIVLMILAVIMSYSTYSVAIKNHRFEARVTEVMELVHEEALIETSKEDLFDAMIGGMMKSLDEHSAYFSGKDFVNFDNDLKQQFGGVGMYVDINPKDNRLTVMSPIPESPAFEAGVRTGDIIDSIDGTSTVNMSREDAVNLMRGPVDTSVDVTFLRGQTERPTTLTRKMIPVPSVRGEHRHADTSWNYMIKGEQRIAYVHLIQFGEKTTQELADILPTLDEQSDALIIDLRNNTGGYLEKALEVCNMFLDGKFKIIETRRRGGVLEEEYFSEPGVLYASGKPIVILVNRFSASASEIVAACLQDHGRALIMGEQSYGKGTVQNVIPIDQGRSAIKLTVASYWRPSGENIDRSVSQARGDKTWGVLPDRGFKIDLSEDDVFQNMRIRNQRASLFATRKDAPGQRQDNKQQDPEQAPNSIEIPEPTDDPVLKRAIEYLQKLLQNDKAA